MNYEEELKKLKEKINTASTMKVKAEAALESIENTRKEYLEQVKNLGVDPQNLESEINSLKTEINFLLEEANSLLPKDI
ncbi:hypothetical protein [uncultured Peptoniphilus sp.]|uniref:hypothetical protein n=1 Tax=uncultured Peptoniphilus sp. TaxID=254354 RepID=UPI002805DFB7|nr:hypothetical protein [uncultured Peptoniphilus sp.]